MPFTNRITVTVSEADAEPIGFLIRTTLKTLEEANVTD
jgi:hypothetical protein